VSESWTRVGATLKQILERMSLSRSLEGWRAVELWERVVEGELGRHTRAVSYAGGKLFVEADSPAWNYELSFSKEAIRSRLNEELGVEAVRDIVVSLARERRR